MLRSFFGELSKRWRFGFPIGDGYRIKQLQRDLFQISRHEDWAVQIVAELTTGEISRHLYSDVPDFWRPPQDHVRIPDDTKAEIVRVVQRYFESHGQRVKVI